MTTLPRDTSTAARPDTYDMIVVHRIFRREFALLPDLIRSVANGDRSRSRTLAAHYRLVAAVLDHHHTGEDELIWPKLLERVELRADLVHRMEEQHRALHDLLDSVDGVIGSWEATADAREGSRLAAILQKLKEAAGEHLRDEEREILPLIEEHLSVKEWHALAESGQRGHSKRRLLLILGLMLEEATPEERTKLLHMLPIQARAVWQAYGAGAYRRYQNRVRKPDTAMPVAAMRRAADRPDTFDMRLVHRVFRRELHLIPAAVRAVPAGDIARATIVANHQRQIIGLLQHHQRGEDAVIWPKVRARASLPEDCWGVVERQAEQVHQLVTRCSGLADRWSTTPTATLQESLAEALDELAHGVDEQLGFEERELVPMIERHLSAAEWNELGESGQHGRSKRQLLLTLGLMLEDASPQDRSKFLAKLPFPARPVWQFYGRTWYRRNLRRDMR